MSVKSNKKQTTPLSPESHLYDPMLKHENGVKLTDGLSNGNHHHHQESSLPRISSPRNMNLFHYIPARLVLYFLSWSGFLVSFMMRNDINFAIVVMAKDANKTINSLNGNASSSNETFTTTTILTDNNESIEGEFDWDSRVVSMILSSFYWMYVLSQVVGGVATQHFGTKNVFGWSQLATAICSLCIPAAASAHWGVLVLVRSIQGFASGLTWPAMYAIVAPWIPAVERSRFMSSFQGFSIGIGLTYPLCGFIIASFGWRPVFYTTGTIGILWCIMWYFLAFDTPSDHPRISQQELEYIELNVGSEIKDNLGMRVPWKAIFTSLPAWSIGITTFGRIWVHYTFIMSGPLYMKNILNFDIKKNGVLSGLPFLCSYLSSVVFCYIADWLVKHRILSLTNVRKVMTASSQIIPGLLIVALGYLGREIYSVLVLWFIAVTMITASYAGAMANIVDLAPNLAGPVLAFAQTIHMTASFLSPLVSGFILTDNNSLMQWQQVFLLASVVAIVTYIMFQIFGTAEIQSWNYPKQAIRPSEQEALNKTSNGNAEHA